MIGIKVTVRVIVEVCVVRIVVVGSEEKSFVPEAESEDDVSEVAYERVLERVMLKRREVSAGW